ncbi:MAG TPA: hypothetical protein VN634_14420 [Candidatus Limnocylindrales bacterium]|nr:hypothetical protein [Candidatus Limnocylindrales bacterium]
MRNIRMMRTERACAAALWCWLAIGAAPAHAALCGDVTGDGFFKASDGLQTLRYAVASKYDRRGDVWPSPQGDGKLTASDALDILRKSVEGVIPSCLGATATRAVVTTAPIDFSSAGLAVVALGPEDVTKRSVSVRLGALSTDAVVRAPSGVPIVINRTPWNTLQFLDVDKPSLPNVKECSVNGGIRDEGGANPQDVLLVSGSKGYVTPYRGDSLFVIDPDVLLHSQVDPACKTLIKGHIDLSGFDGDGIPEMDQMVMVGTDLFVSMQLLDNNHAPTHGAGRIAVIDTATDTLKGSIALSFANPFAATKGLPYDEFQNRIFVGGPGRIPDDTGDGSNLEDGAIEAIDPSTMQSAGVLLTGADIHANIFDFVIVGTGRAFAIIADQESNSVVEIDLVQRKIKKVLLSSQALISDIEMTETGELWVAYRGEDNDDPSGIRIFRVAGGSDISEITARPISLGQAPFTLAFVP